MIDARDESWPLVKVISGLQAGADQAALFLAAHLGYATGGWCPRGARTESGLRPDLRDRFGLQEVASEDYGVRTLLNILYSDGTVVFGDVQEPGSALTVRLAMVHKDGTRVLTNPDPAYLRVWIRAQGIQTLNVAGNRLSKNPLIHDTVVAVLHKALWQPGMREDRLPALRWEPLQDRRRFPRRA